MIENLRAFNRRERFLVVGWALDNREFTAGADFRAYFQDRTGITIPVDAFCAMDFPFDWLAGYLWLTQREQARYSILETGEVASNNEAYTRAEAPLRLQDADLPDASG